MWLLVQRKRNESLCFVRFLQVRNVNSIRATVKSGNRDVRNLPIEKSRPVFETESVAFAGTSGRNTDHRSMVDRYVETTNAVAEFKSLSCEYLSS
jgi:hypothetical protein